MRRADQATGLVVLGVSLLVMERSWRMPQGGTFGPGEGFLPFWVSALMAVLSLLLVARASLAPAAAGDRPVLPARSAAVPVALTVLGLGVYIALLETLGFVLDTALLTALLLGVVQRQRWITTLAVAVANALGLYLIFHTLLGVSLPTGALGF